MVRRDDGGDSAKKYVRIKQVNIIRGSLQSANNAVELEEKPIFQEKIVSSCVFKIVTSCNK